MNLSPKTDNAETRWGDYREGYFVDASLCRSIEIELHGTIEQLKIARGREYVAIRSWEEERRRNLREAKRVIEANRLLEEAFGFVNPPLADAISEYLAQFNPLNFDRYNSTNEAKRAVFGNRAQE